ncbi:MAG TPA: hypothetical protein VG097_14220 [Gemmata sp.]|nr:hypothetical protein [Gemmata sp.]
MNNNPFVELAKNFLSGGIDVLGNELKKRAGLPSRSPAALPNAGNFSNAAAELAEVMDYPARWSDDEKLVVLSILKPGREYKVIACDRGDIVEIVLPTGLRFPPAQVPDNLAGYLLTRNVRIPFGGYDLCHVEGNLVLRCRATLPADTVTGELLHTTINILIGDVAELYDQLDL